MVHSPKLTVQLFILMIQIGNAAVKLLQQYLPHLRSTAESLRFLIDSGFKIHISSAK